MRRILAALGFVALGAVLAGFLGHGSSQRDGARLLDQVVARLQREAIDTLSLDDIYEKAARGLVQGIDDPYAALFSPQELARFNRESLGNAYGGVGMLIEDQNGTFVVARVFPNSPGEAGGVQAGDRIVEVDGAAVRGLKLEQVSRKLLGTPGSEVQVTFLREGVDAPVRQKFTRALVHVPSVPYTLVMGNGVGYVALQRFNETASDELGTAVQSLVDRGARGLVLDLRGNPGGELEQAIKVASLFLPPGRDVVAVRYRARPAELRRTGGMPVTATLPLVVLTDGGTASAAEIVAGALQDHDRGLLVGGTSFGKGVVQTLFPLDGGWMLKLTNARWFTPSGRLIQRDRKATDTLALADSLRPAFRTDAGRTVLGGGGIVPDVKVAADTLSTPEQVLNRALLKRARETSQVLGEMARELKPGLTPAFRVQPAWRDTLYRRLVRAGVEATRPQFDAARPLVDRLLEQRLARTAFGDSAAFRRFAPEDAPLRRALDLLGGARTQADLLQVAERREKAGRG